MKQNKNIKYAEYGKDYIKRTCDEFGPRFAGTESEKKAIDYLDEELEQFCDKKYIDKFKIIPNLYPRGFILICGVLSIVAAPFFFLKSPFSIIAAILPAFGLFVVWSTFFLMAEWFGFLFKKETSYNSTGRVLPKDGSGNSIEGKKKVIVCGHIDSAYQMDITNYGDKIYLVAAPGIFFLLMEIVLGIVKVILFSVGEPKIYAQTSNGWFILSLIDIIFLVIAIIGAPALFYLIKGLTSGTVTHGANDNLSGIGVGLALAKYFAEDGNRLKNVELWVGGFGAEECGERGAHAFVKKYGKKGMLDNAHAVIPDSTGAGDRLTIISKEKIHYATHDMWLCEELLKGYNNYAQEIGVDPQADAEEKKKYHLLPCNIQELPMAASDAGRFSLAGYSGASLIIFEGSLSKPKYWHNHLDTADNIEIPSMVTTFGTIKHFILNLEKSLE